MINIYGIFNNSLQTYSLCVLEQLANVTTNFSKNIISSNT